MSERIVLLHSPLLGGLTWRGVADVLRARGLAAEVVEWPKLTSLDGDFYRGLATAMAASLGEGPATVVVHSGAGALVPALEAASGAIEGVIFADAILPHPGRSWFDTAPPQLADSLRSGAEFGMLPAWDAWWPPGALAQDYARRQRYWPAPPPPRASTGQERPIRTATPGSAAGARPCCRGRRCRRR